MALSSLAGHVQNTVDVGTLKEVRSCVTAAINLIRAHQGNAKPFLGTKAEPATKHIEKQRSFFSTKRKRKKATVRIQKPTPMEKDYICCALLEKHTSLYYSTNTESQIAPITKSTLSKT